MESPGFLTEFFFKQYKHKFMQLISSDTIWKECHLVKHWLISNTGLVHSGNSLHAVETGLNPKRGENNHNTSLFPFEIEKIKQLLLQGSKQKELAEMFGVDQSTISRIVNKKTWKYATAS